MCPRCGRAVDGIHVHFESGGMVMAVHRLEGGKRKYCYIATLERLKAVGVNILDIVELRWRLRKRDPRGG